MGELRALTLCDRITRRSSDRKRTFSKFHYGGNHVCLTFYTTSVVASSMPSSQAGLRMDGVLDSLNMSPHLMPPASPTSSSSSVLSSSTLRTTPFSFLAGYKRDNIQLLPSSVTKREVWELYSNALSHQQDSQTVASFAGSGNS